jgi:hypothetical protein
MSRLAPRFFAAHPRAHPSAHLRIRTRSSPSEEPLRTDATSMSPSGIRALPYRLVTPRVGRTVLAYATVGRPGSARNDSLVPARLSYELGRAGTVRVGLATAVSAAGDASRRSS